MGKKILAVVAGLLVNSVVVMIVQMIGHSISAPPEGMDKIFELDWDEKVALTAQLETIDYVFVLLSWAAGAFVAGMVASKIIPSYWKKSSFVIGVAIALTIIVLVYSIPHPTWVTVVGIVLSLPMAYLGAKIFGMEEAA